MESGVLNSLSLMFLVAGGTLWLTSLALTRRARQYQAAMQTLLKLASLNLEPLEIPAAAWPVLQTAGWQGLHWEGDWYGQDVQGTLGRTQDAMGAKAFVQNFALTSGTEVQLSVCLSHNTNLGERHLFASQLAQVFLLLLETRLRERTGALSVALAERARLSLYLQHDMRNMAQWVSWVSADFVSAQTPHALQDAAQRLKDNAPLAQERALRLIAALGKSPHAVHPCQIDLRLALDQAAQLAGLELQVEGAATAWIAPDALARALDNLLGNLASDWRNSSTAMPSVKLAELLPEGQRFPIASITLCCPLPTHGMGVAPEKLFEPFASGRPGGLGLGLYQARQSLREAGGRLSASVQGAQLQFVLELPQQSMQEVL
ncbi:MAG: hypothetical protein IPH35_06150 [Rhodoferax sp.]|nr:hypothetical protein [Rhodoferax sp.]